MARGGVEPPTFRFSGRRSDVPGRPSPAFRLVGRDGSDTRAPANGVELRPELRPRPRTRTVFAHGRHTSIAGFDHPACSYLPLLIKAAPCGRRAALRLTQPQALARGVRPGGRSPRGAAAAWPAAANVIRRLLNFRACPFAPKPRQSQPATRPRCAPAPGSFPVSRVSLLGRGKLATGIR